MQIKKGEVCRWQQGRQSNSTSSSKIYSPLSLSLGHQICQLRKVRLFARLLCPWHFPGNSTGVDCHFLLQGTSRSRDRTQVSHIVDRRLTVWATREVHLDSILKKSILPTNPSSQSYGFSGSHVQMWELDYKGSWMPKNWCFWTVVLEKTLESPLDWKEIKPVNCKGNQSWIFIGRNDAEAETPTLAT